MKLALIGYGRMGHAVEAIARERDHEIVAILDTPEIGGSGTISPELLGSARMAIDFSSAEAVPINAPRLADLGVGLVIGTTGWAAEQSRIESAVRDAGTGLLHAPNFSVGMLLFSRIVEAAARMADRIEGYDAHLFEAHHRHKMDHPGGTARRLADLLVAELSSKTRWSTDPPAGRAVESEVLQVAVARVGEVPGVHEVGFEGPDDRIELRHEARNRRGFARGAVLAAEWLEGRTGVFSMEDLVTDLLGSDEGPGPD